MVGGCVGKSDGERLGNRDRDAEQLRLARSSPGPVIRRAGRQRCDAGLLQHEAVSARGTGEAVSAQRVIARRWEIEWSKVSGEVLETRDDAAGAGERKYDTCRGSRNQVELNLLPRRRGKIPLIQRIR